MLEYNITLSSDELKALGLGENASSFEVKDKVLEAIKFYGQKRPQAPGEVAYYLVDIDRSEPGDHAHELHTPYLASICIKADHYPSPDEILEFYQDDLKRLYCDYVVDIKKISKQKAYSLFDMRNEKMFPVLTKKTSNPKQKKVFLVGEDFTYTMLYGGMVHGTVVERTASELTLREDWIAEDTGSTAYAETKYNVFVDGNGDEYIVLWEYAGERGVHYAASVV